MTDQKLLQEAIDRSKNARRIGISPHSTVQAILEEAAEKHLASLTPVPDQARAEALGLFNALWSVVENFHGIPPRYKDAANLIRACIQTPPVAADADELIKRLRAEKAELMETCVELHKENDQLRATPSEVEKMQVPVYYSENTDNLAGLEKGAMAALANLMIKTNSTCAEFMIGNEKDGEFTFACTRKAAPKHAETIAMEGE